MHAGYAEYVSKKYNCILFLDFIISFNEFKSFYEYQSSSNRKVHALHNRLFFDHSPSL